MFNTVGRQAAAVGSALKAPTLVGLSIVESFLKGVCGKDAPAGKPAQEPQKKVEFNDKKINRFFDHKGKVKDAQPLQIARPHLNRAMALDVLVTGNNELLAAHGGKFPAGHKLQIVLSQLGQTPLKIDLNPADIPKSVTEQAIKDIRQAEIGRKRVISAAGAAARTAAARTAAARTVAEKTAARKMGKEEPIAKAGKDAEKAAEDKNPMPLLVQALEAIMRIPAEIKVNINGTDAVLSFHEGSSVRVQLVEVS